MRDRALLLVGFGGAFRRSELVRLRFEDVRFADAGLVVTIPQSKTDPEEEGQTVGIPYGSHAESCPVRALAAWLERSRVPEGYRFPALGRWGGEAADKPLCDHQLAKIIKRLCQRAGLDPSAYFRALAAIRPGDCRGRGRRLRTRRHRSKRRAVLTDILASAG